MRNALRLIGRRALLFADRLKPEALRFLIGKLHLEINPAAIHEVGLHHAAAPAPDASDTFTNAEG
ncbi:MULTISPECIES: hypothetical protein [Dermabacter]|uniref:hypothetical protein n=1 Tax=Dermabacter TaxID=36739 RepID=UPI0011CB987C|nr:MULTISPECIES: hypothetical protein [Dermabacter]